MEKTNPTAPRIQDVPMRDPRAVRLGRDATRTENGEIIPGTRIITVYDKKNTANPTNTERLYVEIPETYFSDKRYPAGKNTNPVSYDELIKKSGVDTSYRTIEFPDKNTMLNAYDPKTKSTSQISAGKILENYAVQGSFLPSTDLSIDKIPTDFIKVQVWDNSKEGNNRFQGTISYQEWTMKADSGESNKDITYQMYVDIPRKTIEAMAKEADADDNIKALYADIEAYDKQKGPNDEAIGFVRRDIARVKGDNLNHQKAISYSDGNSQDFVNIKLPGITSFQANVHDDFGSYVTTNGRKISGKDVPMSFKSFSSAINNYAANYSSETELLPLCKITDKGLSLKENIQGLDVKSIGKSETSFLVHIPLTDDSPIKQDVVRAYNELVERTAESHPSDSREYFEKLFQVDGVDLYVNSSMLKTDGENVCVAIKAGDTCPTQLSFVKQDDVFKAFNQFKPVGVEVSVDDLQEAITKAAGTPAADSPSAPAAEQTVEPKKSFGEAVAKSAPSAQDQYSNTISSNTIGSTIEDDVVDDDTFE